MKTKKSKKNISDKINSKSVSKRLNPFEVHINKQKHVVLGKKSKNEKGLPGISRSRAIKKVCRNTDKLVVVRIWHSYNMIHDIAEKIYIVARV